jgi:hypothetical protein
MQLQDRVRIFHENNCRGLITSTEEGGIAVLRCSECGKIVGTVNAGVLAQLANLAPAA